VLAALLVLVIAAGAIAAGIGYVRTARRMRGFATTQGTITSRDVGLIAGAVDPRDPRFGKGGNWTPRFTYAYDVAGMRYTGDKLGYATRGFRRSVAEQQAAEMPDKVVVHFDPAEPGDAYLQTNTPTLGWWLIALGVVLALGAVVALLPS
jgi:hypothetical protein